MMHVRGRAASKDDLELARRSALTQEKISFGVTHVAPMGGLWSAQEHGGAEAAGDGADPATDAPKQRAGEATVCSCAAESASIGTSQYSGAASITRGRAADATRSHLAGPHR